MKVKKSKLLAALSSILSPRPLAMAADRGLLAEIEAAVARCTDGRHDALAGDAHVHEILFLVSNAPGAITFLARRISARVEAAREAAAAVKALVLVHRLLRGGDRYFEQDLRGSWVGGELRVGAAARLAAEGGSDGGFLSAYSSFLEERLGWVINQAGSLEPVRARKEEPAAGWECCYRLRKCQDFLDRVTDFEPSEVPGYGQEVRSAFGIVVRESIRVYETFSDGVEDLETMLSSYSELDKSIKGLAADILHKACTQTPKLQDFFEKCKRAIDGKNLDYPFVRVVTAAEVASIESRTSCSDQHECKLFSRKLETTISTVWVEFDESGSQTSSFFSLGASDDAFTGGAPGDDPSWRGREAMR